MLRLLIMCLVAAGLSVGTAGNGQASDEFADATFEPLQISIAAKWRLIQAQMNSDAARLVVCRADSEACGIEDRRLVDIVDAARARDGLARIGAINRSVNLGIRPVSDLQRFGLRDHWSAPLETLRAGVGDCEDYALLKFLALREVGFSEDDVQFLIVRDSALQTDHAVVTVRHEDRWVVLDNRTLVLGDLQSTLLIKRYRVLAQLGRDIDTPAYAGVALPAPARIK